MQRDVYFSMFFGACPEMITINLFHLNGCLTRERMYKDVLIGQRNRHLIMMTHMALTNPQLRRLKHDILIPDMETLRRIHQPHFIYRLIPLLCRDYDTFEGMQAICSSPNSPFTIADRQDPKTLTHRFVFKCARRREIAEFFKDVTPVSELSIPAVSRKLPIRGLEFTGLMMKSAKVTVCNTITPNENINSNQCTSNISINKNAENNNKSVEPHESLAKKITKTTYLSAAALVTTHNYLNERTITERSLMRDYFNSPLYAEINNNTLPLFVQIARIERQLHFMICTRPVGGNDLTMRKHLIRFAAEKNLYMYERGADGKYHYATL